MAATNADKYKHMAEENDRLWRELAKERGWTDKQLEFERALVAAKFLASKGHRVRGLEAYGIETLQ